MLILLILFLLLISHLFLVLLVHLFLPFVSEHLLVIHLSHVALLVIFLEGVQVLIYNCLVLFLGWICAGLSHDCILMHLRYKCGGIFSLSISFNAVPIHVENCVLLQFGIDLVLPFCTWRWWHRWLFHRNWLVQFRYPHSLTIFLVFLNAIVGHLIISHLHRVPQGRHIFDLLLF